MGSDHFGNATASDEDVDVVILLASGRDWHPFRPRPTDFEWSDLAAGLSRIPRFNGQFPADGIADIDSSYSVGQHLCLCFDLVRDHMADAPPWFYLAVLLHDAEEALAGLGDPVGPVKHSRRFRGLFKPYFDNIQDAIAAKVPMMPDWTVVNGDTLRSLEVKRFDKMAFAIENKFLRGRDNGSAVLVPYWHMSERGLPRDFTCWSIQYAHQQWLAHLHWCLERLGHASMVPGQ